MSMRTSKFVGKTYGSRGKRWQVTKIYLAANYEHCTRHNYYRYLLERVTSDGKCYKKLVVSAATMRKIANRLADPEDIAERKGLKLNYQFIGK